MPKSLSEEQVAAYHRDGYVSPIRVLSAAEMADRRARLEAFEADSDGPLAGGLRFKPHLLLTWLDDLIRHPRILDAVEDVLGPNIMCWGSAFFTKEARDQGYISWHQDSTYWGLSGADVVTAWLAFSPSTAESGCMQVIPGTHRLDQQLHHDTHADANMLSRGQVIQMPVDEQAAVDTVLQPGEISLHHIRLIHGSKPNPSDDRRIGFAIRYIPPHLHQINGPEDLAMLVRGEDPHHNFELEVRPESDMHPDAIEHHARAAELHGQLLYQGTDRQPFT